MASVIQTLSGEHVGADATYVHSTWSAKSHLQTLWWTIGSASRDRAAAAIRGRPPPHVRGGSFVREGGLAVVAGWRELPTVVTLHGADFDASASKHPWLVRRVLRASGAITCLDRRQVPRIEDLAPKHRVSHVPNPVAIRNDVPDASTTEPLVLFAGEIGTRKGADVLSEAWRTVKSALPDATCILIGPATSLELAPQDGLEVRSAAPAAEIADLVEQCRCVAFRRERRRCR